MTSLFLVSTGPGDLDLMTAQAKAALAQTSDVVAYGLYTDLLGELTVGKTCHGLPLGEETARARLALDLAASGKPTALVSSGDIGIYAMGTLVFELLDQQLNGQHECPQWLDVDIHITPGISAMQAASSRVGALLGHDFCTISLSDLLTPWPTIEQRIQAAGVGDFVVSFYNPVSKKRDWQLASARDILLQYRDANTPVVLGYNLTRESEAISHITLGELDPMDVDMFTVVCVGNSQSRRIVNQQATWVYTPRGYAAKQTAQQEGCQT